MDQQLRVRDAVPDGFVVDCATVDAAQVTFVLRSIACRARFPLCGFTAGHVHSRIDTVPPTFPSVAAM